MRDDGIATTVMLGLCGFRVLAVSEHDGEIEQAVETTVDEGWCPSCGVWARLHDRRPTWVRDLPAAGRSVTLVWVKRVWRCHESRCPRKTWTETSDAIRARCVLTERARREACRRVGHDGHTVAAVAAMGCQRLQTHEGAGQSRVRPETAGQRKAPGNYVRKFAVKAAHLDDLVGLGTLTNRAARFLDACVVAGLNVLVAGGGGCSRCASRSGRQRARCRLPTGA